MGDEWMCKCVYAWMGGCVKKKKRRADVKSAPTFGKNICRGGFYTLPQDIMGLKIFVCQKGLGISLKVVNLYRLKDILKKDSIVKFEDKYERE